MSRPASSVRKAKACSTGSTNTRSRRSRPSPTKPCARDTARVFCDELLRNGTTTRAGVLLGACRLGGCAVRGGASAATCGSIAGKVLMDRNAPADLLDTARSGYDQSKALIGRWHSRGRCLYAITPRFAATSSPPSSWNWRARSGASIPTCSCRPISRRTATRSHGSQELFPRTARLSRRLCAFRADRPARRACTRHPSRANPNSRAVTKAALRLSHCPTSNMFLGSGLFRLREARDARRPVQVGLGTDIGAGTSFSLLATMGEAYKVAQLQRPRRCRRSRHFSSQRSAARARSRSTTGSGRWQPAARPTSWCSIRTRRR